MLGYEADELLSMSYLDITPEKWHSMQQKIIEEQVTPRGHSEIFEIEYRKKDGTVFPIEMRIQLIRDDEGYPNVMWAIVHDITERKRIQDNLSNNSSQLEELNISLEKRVENAILELRQRDQVLLQQNRLATMGEMINNIAHQWRQPLNTLGLYIQLLPSEYKMGGINKEYVDKYVKDSMMIIDHMSRTIDDFSCFFKPDKKPFNLSRQAMTTIILKSL
jgi:PAS domain S-box-containing protein